MSQRKRINNKARRNSRKNRYNNNLTKSLRYRKVEEVENLKLLLLKISLRLIKDQKLNHLNRMLTQIIKMNNR